MIRTPRLLRCSALLVSLLVLAACKQTPSATPVERLDAEAASTTAQTTTDPVAHASAAPAPGVESDPAPAPETDAPSAAAASSGWQYDERASSTSAVPRARIASDDGAAQLVFENHPVTGRNAHLALPTEVDCPTGCRVTLRLDGAAGTEMRASRPESADVRLNLRDPRGLWNALGAANTLAIDYPAASGPATVTFRVAGLELSRMPGWEQ